MNPQELSAYIAGLLRSGPEIITAFIMGVVLTGVIAYAFRRWAFPSRDGEKELARKEAEIARKDAELARKDAEVARLESKWSAAEALLTTKDDQISGLRKEVAALAEASKSPASQEQAALERCSRLEAENGQLSQAKQSLEQTIEQLQTKLGHVSGELAHSAKWLKAFEEENATLREQFAENGAKLDADAERLGGWRSAGMPRTSDRGDGS